MPGPEPERAEPRPGDVYVFGTQSAFAIEWLVVRQHPDAADLVLVIPLEDGICTGVGDFVLAPAHTGYGCPVICHGNLSDWVASALLPATQRVTRLPDNAVQRARKYFASSYSDIGFDPGCTAQDDEDAAYQETMAAIAAEKASVFGAA
jgi:hypothetical protein